jgi:hypothetical protein
MATLRTSHLGPIHAPFNTGSSKYVMEYTKDPTVNAAISTGFLLIE